jgi:hypothetical protein
LRDLIIRRLLCYLLRKGTERKWQKTWKNLRDLIRRLPCNLLRKGTERKWQKTWKNLRDLIIMGLLYHLLRNEAEEM